MRHACRCAGIDFSINSGLDARICVETKQGCMHLSLLGLGALAANGVPYKHKETALSEIHSRSSICPDPHRPAEMRAARLRGAARHPDLVASLPRAHARPHAKRRAESDRRTQHQRLPRIVAMASGDCHLEQSAAFWQKHPHLGIQPTSDWHTLVLQRRWRSRRPRRRTRPTRSAGRKAAAAPAAPTSGARRVVAGPVSALRDAKAD